jgi:hypothetical protein
LGVPLEIRNRSGTIEKFSGKIKFVAENLQLLLNIQISSRTANVHGEDLNFRAKI